MSSTVYDYVIVGAGAAGLHMAFAMLRESWFADKKILLLDREIKNSNDKTWCFWEKDGGNWDNIISHSWDHGKFLSNDHNIDLNLSPYKYKMLDAFSFYDYAKQHIGLAENFNWKIEEVLDVERKEQVEVITNKTKYYTKQVFDSRIDPSFYTSGDKYLRLLQHFKGWFIKTKEKVFNPASFVMMDYRIKWKDSTSFIYLLPTSSNEALIEFTFFSPDLVEDEVYDEQLHKYVHDILKLTSFTIERTEQGIIPMSNFPFHHNNQEGILKIGTAGSWVKPSSGYSFKNAEKSAARIINNIIKGNPLSQGVFRKKYNIYDTLFLEVLNTRNELGEHLFGEMYHKNSVQQIFRFLDEESSLLQDIILMGSLKWAPFIKAFKDQYITKNPGRT